MNVRDVIRSRRSIRKYKQKAIERSTLEALIEGARLAPSAANLQPLEYILVDDKELLDEVFETLAWAAYIAPEGTPKENERPTAYIVVLIKTEDKSRLVGHDAGAAIMSILLEAHSYGIGSCWIGSAKREELKGILNIPNNYEIDSVIALGYPAEASIFEDMTDSIKYYRDDKGVLHVPKRTLGSMLHINGF